MNPLFDGTSIDCPQHSSPAPIQQDAISATPAPGLPEGSGLITQQAGVPQVPVAFTPGPWKYIEFPECDGVGYIRPADEDGLEISHHGDMHRSAEENRANAHLIAAAPEMYMSLLDLQGLIRLWMSRDDIPQDIKNSYQSHWRWTEADSAIAKAIGGAA